MSQSGTESAPESAFVQAKRAAALIHERTPLRPQFAEPKIAIVLGTGLGGFADRLTDAIAIPYAEIPHFPRPTVEGHAGRLVIGSFAGIPLVVMPGRVHAYEGYTPQQVIYPTRGLARLRMDVLGFSSVTNMAAGVLDEPINHAEVLEIGARVQQTLARLLAALVPLLAEPPDL